MEPEDLREELMLDQLHVVITTLYQRLCGFNYQDAAGMASVFTYGIRNNLITIDSVVRVMLRRDQGHIEHQIYTVEDLVEELQKEVGG